MAQKKLTITTNKDILLNSSSTVKTNNSIILKDNNNPNNKLYKIYSINSDFSNAAYDILTIPQLTINKSYCIINVKAYYNKINNSSPFDIIFGYHNHTRCIYFNNSIFTNTVLKTEESVSNAISFTVSNTVDNIILRCTNNDTNYSSISYSFDIEYHYYNFS